MLDRPTKSATVRIGKETFTLGPEGIAWTGHKQPRREVVKRGAVAWFRLEIPETKPAPGKKPATAADATPPPAAAAGLPRQLRCG